jgi:SAM-dependent methyltransferase
MPAPVPATIAPPAPAPPRRSRIPKLPKKLDSLFALGGVALLVWVVSRYPLREIGAATRALGPLVVLAFIIPLGWHASGAAAVWLLFERRIPWRKLVWARLAADAYNSLLFSVGGEPFRVRFLSRFVPTDEVVAVLLRDRMLDMASGYFVSGGFLLVGLRHFPLPAAMRASLGVYALVTMALGVCGVLLVATRLPGRAGALVKRAVGGGSATSVAPLSVGAVLRVTPFYLVSRALGVLELAVLLRLLGGAFNFGAAGFFDGVLNAAGTISFFVPGALGVFEGTSVFLFKMASLGGPQGLAFSLVRRARMILFSIVGVVLHWLGRRGGSDEVAATATAAATTSSWRRTLRRWAYTYLQAPFGIGRPQAVAQWDDEYAGGKWRKLDSAAQLGHYALIAGYVAHFTQTPASIVDVGCGHGRLYELLRRAPYRRYVGLDISPEAIRQATAAYGSDTTRFEVASFEEWHPDERFDVIIFNESIYYAKDPLRELERWVGLLSPDGIVVLSIVQSSMNAGVARRIRRRFAVSHLSRVRNERGETWEVSVIPRPAAK